MAWLDTPYRGGGVNPALRTRRPALSFWHLFHARRVLHPDHTYSTCTGSLSSVHGWHKPGRPLTARASLSDKFSPLWLAVRTIVGNGVDQLIPGATTVDWQCTEHGLRWSDPLRWTPGVLLHRVVDTAANIATSSGRHSEGRFVSLFSVPPCSPPLLVELAGSTYVAPAKVIRTALDTHGPSSLLRLLDQSTTPLKSARGVKFTADGFAHLEATPRGR